MLKREDKCSSDDAIKIYSKIQNNPDLMKKLEEKASWYKLTHHGAIVQFGDPTNWE